MKTTLSIIVDVSGSMNEMGKFYLQRNLCRYVGQLHDIDKKKYADFHFRFFQWGQDISEIVDIPSFDFNMKGSACLKRLSEFIAQEYKQCQRYIILSDGYFSTSGTDINYQEPLKSFSDLIICPIAVGVDAKEINLKKLAINSKVSFSEDIFSAVDEALFFISGDIMPPDCTSHIRQSE